MAIDATVGGALADSYLLVAAADALASDDIGRAADAWVAADAIRKEKALKRATREIEAYLGPSVLLAGRYSDLQARLYPRAEDVTSGTPFIPRAIVNATWAQAKFLIVNADALDAAQSRAARRNQSVSESGTSWTREDGASSAPFICDEAKGYLTGAFGGASSVRSIRLSTDYSGRISTDLLP